MTFVYCRPHVKTISQQDRFVVRTHRGIKTDRGLIKEGEEFPADIVSEYWLQCLYEQMQIDLMPGSRPDAEAPQAQETGEKAPGEQSKREESAASRPDSPQSPQASQPGAPVPMVSTPAVSQAPKPELPENLNVLTRKQLQELCARHGLGSDGKTDDLRARLTALVA
jgi:hypothetical protein